MREQHELRVGKLLFANHLICAIFMTVGLISQLAMSGMAPILSIVPLALNWIVFIVCLVAHIRFKDERYPRVVAVSFSIVYFAILLMAQSNSTYPYMIPFLVGFVLCLDKPSVQIGSVAFVVANLIRVIMIMASAEDPIAVIEGVMIEVIITALITISVNRGLKQLLRFFDESIAEIREQDEKNQEIGRHIIDVATDVESKSGRIQEELDVLTEASVHLNESMSNISDGITNTTEAIVNQTTQTQDIQDSLDAANRKTLEMSEITSEARSALEEGTAAMQQLFSYVNESIGSSEEMHTASIALQEKSNEVRGITSIILNISSQTNLLALNASIEAARAGEAGRGFSVVADEIRNLAEQTRTETENITSLIDQLSGEAQSMIDKVEANVAVSNRENECATEASSKFDEISAKVNDLAEHMAEITALVSGLLEANNIIVDNVNTLSATSEEITASTQEAVETSSQNVEAIREFSESMKTILNEIRDLEAFTTK